MTTAGRVSLLTETGGLKPASTFCLRRDFLVKKREGSAVFDCATLRRSAQWRLGRWREVPVVAGCWTEPLYPGTVNVTV